MVKKLLVKKNGDHGQLLNNLRLHNINRPKIPGPPLILPSKHRLNQQYTIHQPKAIHCSLICQEYLVPLQFLSPLSSDFLNNSQLFQLKLIMHQNSCQGSHLRQFQQKTLSLTLSLNNSNKIGSISSNRNYRQPSITHRLVRIQ